MLEPLDRRQENEDRPCLTSTHRAPRGTSSGLTSFALGRRRRDFRPGSAGSSSNGELSGSSGGAGRQVRASSGSRRPIGESPGTRARCPRRNVQRVVTQPGWSPRPELCSALCTGCRGITQPTGSPRPSWSRAARVARRASLEASDPSVGATSMAGGSPAGRRASTRRRCRGSS